MKVSFYDSRGTVTALVTDKGKRARVSMGIKTSPYKFVGRFLGKGARIDQLNHELDERRVVLSTICLQHGIDNVRQVYSPEPTKWREGTDVANLCSDYVDLMRSGEIRTRGGKRYALDSIRTYAQSADYLSQFFKYHEKKTGCRYDIRQMNLELKAKAVESWKAMFRKFEGFMTEKGLGVRTRQNAINQVGIMTRYWAEVNFMRVPKVPSVLAAEKDIIALPPSFVGEFLTSDIPSCPEMRMVWEVAATILVTTLRIKDIISLSPSDFSADFKFIRKSLSKSGTCSMPIPERLSAIYRENLANNGGVFSMFPTRILIYQHLKTLMSGYASLHEPLTVVSMDLVGERVSQTTPYWQWVTPHVLRKTAITSMMYHGVSDIHVRHASGHSHTSKAFWSYVKVVDDMYKSDISNAHEKMGISSRP